MNLHKHKDAFFELISVTAENVGLPQLYVEKDYWVTKALKHLSESIYSDQVVFKGGTSLSKAYGLIHRFSEDIDLAVFDNHLGDAARKKLLKNIENTASYELVYLSDDVRESKGSKYRKIIYQYPRNIAAINFGQASSELLLEINAFTNPEPFQSQTLRSLIAETLQNIKRADLIDQYDLNGFAINVLSVERTLVEKILGVIKDSYSEDPIAKLSIRIRHLYDICLILKHNEYREFVKSSKFKELCRQCIDDEQSGFLMGNKCFDSALSSAPLFSQIKHWHSSLNTTYTGVFSDLVYADLPPMDDIVETLNFIEVNIE